MTSTHFNPHVARLSMPPIPMVRQWAAGYDGRLGPLIDLSQAVPGYAPHARLLAALAEAAGSPRYAGYGPIDGEEVLRAAYARHLEQVYGAAVAVANVHISAGCNQAFAAAVMALVGPGESVLLPSPFYFNHQTTLAMLGASSVTVDCHAALGFVPRLEDIAAALNPAVRAVVLVTPNNPTGAVYPPELLRDILALCRARGLWLLLDETYRDFLPAASGDAAPHGLFQGAAWQDNLVALYSFSKSFCMAGHRLGAVTAGAPVVAQIAKVMDNLQICAPRAPQAAVAATLVELADWRAANRHEMARRAVAFRAALAEAPGWRLDAVGAYFAYVHHPFSGQGSEHVARRLASQAGVLAVPGVFFGGNQHQHLRMAFANAGLDVLRGLGERLRSLPGSA